jgi:hypothetical protein
MHWVVVCWGISDERIALVATENNKCERQTKEMTPESESHRGNYNK